MVRATSKIVQLLTVKDSINWSKLEDPSNLLIKNVLIAARNKVCKISFDAYEAALQKFKNLKEKFEKDLKIIRYVRDEGSRTFKFCAYGNLMLPMTIPEIFDAVWEMFKSFEKFIQKLNHLPANATWRNSEECKNLKAYQAIINEFTTIFLEYLNKKEPDWEEVKKFKTKFIFDIFVGKYDRTTNKPKYLWSIMEGKLSNDSKFEKILEKVRDSFKYVIISSWAVTENTLALHSFKYNMPYDKTLDEIATLACEPFGKLSVLPNLFYLLRNK